MADLIDLKYETVLNELRCNNDPQHRLQAARILLTNFNNSNRIAYLLNSILYDPQPEVQIQIKALLYENYGDELESMLKVEGMDEIPIESPWLIPCNLLKNHRQSIEPLKINETIEAMVIEKDIYGLHDALRDPLDNERRLSAIQALVKCHNEVSPEMLARSVIHDPDEAVQQHAYQALYEIMGNEQAEALLDKIGTLEMDEDGEWFLLPDYFDENQFSVENRDQHQSFFGINEADQIRGMINLFTSERNPQKRIVIINTLAQSNDFNVNEAIARVGLFDADKLVRKHAKSVLENRLSENLDEFLEHVYNKASPFVADPEDDSLEIEEGEPFKMKPNDDFSSRIKAQEPVLSESNSIKPMSVIAGIVILVLVVFLILRIYQEKNEPRINTSPTTISTTNFYTS